MRKHDFALILLFFLFSCSKENKKNADTIVPISKLDNSTARTSVKYDFDKFLDLTNYTHWYEGDVPKGYCKELKTKGCAPATYITARRLADKKFAVNVNEYKNAIDGMNTSCKTGTTFSKIGEYAQQSTQFGSKHVSYNSFSREDFKTALKAILNAGKPSIAAVWVVGTSITDVTKDKNGNSIGEGHVVTIYGLQQTKDGTGSIIYYLDPLAVTGGKKSMDYTKFLNSMAVHGAFFVQPINVLKK